ncbi:MAG: YbaN family protein [Pseudomonadota bacterium]
MDKVGYAAPNELKRGGARRALWLCLGLLALALGAIGVVLPILPTTPFVILAAFCFSKSSPRLQAWLENSRLFGPMIADWRRNGAIAPRYKAVSLVTMGVVFLASVVFEVAPTVLVVQAVAITGAATYILTRPSA